MCHSRAKRLFTPAILLLTAFSAVAQKSNNENSPYSRVGIGEKRNGVNTILKGMGSISSAYTNPFSVNTDNPASYASLKLTTYEAGGEASTRTITGYGEKYKTGMATLSYMNIGIPIGKHAGVCIGLRPENRVYYRFDDTGAISGFGNAIASYQGKGSLNYGFIGAAGTFKGFSIGANFGYLFGTIVNSDYIISTDPLSTSKVSNSEFSRHTQIGGIYWKGGVMYAHDLNKELAIRVGGTVTLSQDLNATRNEYWITTSQSIVSNSSTGEFLKDTAKTVNLKSTITLPMTYSAGVQLVGTDQWMAGIDFTSANWSQFRNFGAVDSVATSTYKISVGGQITPNASSMHKYLQRVTYRLGFYYGTDYVRLHNTDMNYYAVTAGLSLPFKRSTDRIHASFEVGQRGTEANGMLKETFVRFGLGLSLNDKWFIKRKYD